MYRVCVEIGVYPMRAYVGRPASVACRTVVHSPCAAAATSSACLMTASA